MHLKVAICIPTFNQSKFLPAAVQSALEQRGVETEVWISDDASNDDTCAEMLRFSGNKRIRYHRQTTNGGIAFNANWVLQQPNADFLVRLDSDDILLPDFCRKLSEMLVKEPTAGVAHCAVEEIDQFGVHRRIRRLARIEGSQSAEDAFTTAITGYRVAANICMFRKKALDSLPFIYRQGMNFCEDWDLFVRLALAGWENVYCAQPLAKYRVWSDVGGYRESRKITELRGIIRFFDETVEPAWAQRGLDEKRISRARLSFTKNHARALLSFPKNSQDYYSFRQLLESLSNNKIKISRHLFILESFAGRIFFDVVSKFELHIRDIFKRLIYH